MVAVLEEILNLKIFDDENPRDIMNQMKFIMIESGIILEIVKIESDSVTYKFSTAEFLEGE